MTNKRPGDVLAGRYRLDDLLSETGQGRFWRGHDQVLSRPVAIHVLDADDERAIGLMDAARDSAQVVEPRLLRVLDVENDGRICYVVNEWGRGTSLDLLLAAEGPLPPRRAAWIVDEVAIALANAHDHGVAHGRLNPENVLIDTTGSIRLIGFAVEAALYGLGSDRIGIDVVDLAGLLHVALTGKWAGLSESGMPRAPREQHGLEYRVLRPRQIRAGVPRVLDDLVDEVLNRPHGRHAGPNTAREIHDALAAYVGDRTGLAEELVSVPPMTVVGGKPATTPALPTEETPDPAPEPAPEPDVTVAGLPIFDDTDESTGGDGTDGTGAGTSARPADVPQAAWFAPREDVPEPPPPLEPPPERPLFAPAPSDGEPVRKARPNVQHTPPGDAAADSATYWPFDAAPEEPPVPGRRWLRLGLALGILLLIGLAVLVFLQLRDGDDTDPSGAGTSSPTSSPTPSRTATARPIAGTTADDFDPFGDPPAENSDLAPRAVDGDASTTWRTSTYRQNLGPGGIKSGVGLIIDLQTAHRVTAVRLTFAKAGAAVSIYVSATPPASADDLGQPAATATTGTSTQVPISPAAAGRYVTVWLTSLPKVAGGFRAEVAEVSVLGTKA
jgi:hypothetical protein